MSPTSAATSSAAPPASAMPVSAPYGARNNADCARASPRGKRVFGRQVCAVTALSGAEATGWADVTNVTVVTSSDMPCPVTQSPSPEPVAAQSHVPAPGIYSKPDHVRCTRTAGTAHRVRGAVRHGCPPAHRPARGVTPYGRRAEGGRRWSKERDRRATGVAIRPSRQPSRGFGAAPKDVTYAHELASPGGVVTAVHTCAYELCHYAPSGVGDLPTRPSGGRSGRQGDQVDVSPTGDRRLLRR